MTTDDIRQVTFRIKKDLVRKLKLNAIQKDTSVTEILNKLVEGYLLQNNNGANKKRK